MPYFQNPFDIEWSGTWILADHRYMPQFKIGPNKNTADIMRAWVVEPYNCSTNASLTINYAFDLDLKNYASLTINVQGANPSATTAIEVCNALNANATFAELWLAQPVSIGGKGVLNINPNSQQLGVNNINSPNPGLGLNTQGAGAPNPYTVTIRSVKRPKQSMRVFISNTGAELSLGFNRMAPVVQLPTYFGRHTIDNRWTYTDCTANLVQLNTSNPADQQVITNAGQDYTNVLADWTFLRGKSEVFPVFVNTYSGSNISTQIMYYVGAQAGDLAVKTEYTYSGSNVISQVSFPYTLQSGDIVTPT